MNPFDLHIHSAYSNDGELEIHELVNKCLSNNIEIFSITDHNIVRGLEEATSLASKSGIDFITGIEIDCNYHGTDLHLLGYQIDWKNSAISQLESMAEQTIMDAVPLMLRNLAIAGIKLDLAEVLEKARGKLPSPELFAEVLLGNSTYHSNPRLLPYLEGGERSDMPYINFYLDYFAQGKPAYVKMELLPFSEAVKVILDSGGIPVVAHPGHNFRGKEEVVTDLLDQGAAGLEVFNNYHNLDQMEFFASLLTKRGGLMTCGSDFHGKTKPLIDIGAFPLLSPYQEKLEQSIEYILHYDSNS